MLVKEFRKSVNIWQKNMHIDKVGRFSRHRAYVLQSLRKIYWIAAVHSA